MSSKIVLITGANTGLGFETVRALMASEQAYTILLGGRSLEKASAAVAQAQKEHPQSPSQLETIHIDIEDDASIERCFQDVKSKFGKLDALVNNAGAQFDPLYESGQMSMREMWNQSWNVNTTSTHIMTNAFVPLLLASSAPRLLFITSGTSTLAETENTQVFVNRSPAAGWPKPFPLGLPAYRSAKTGMNMMARQWVRLLKADGVKVFAVSPGFLATGLGGDPEKNRANGAEDPALGGSFVRDVLEGLRDADAGKAIRRQDVQPW